jgi:Phage integrase family
MNAHLKLVEPRHENRSVPVRPANAELRTREYLTPKEVERLTKTARDGRYRHRDATLILLAFRHGLRASEICDLEWSQVEFGRSAALHVRRAKNGKPSVHPLRGDEIRALRELRRQFPAVSSLSPSAADPSRRMLSTASSSGSASVPASTSSSMCTCCATVAATRWPMQDTTPGRSRTGWVTGRSSIPCAIPSWHRRGLGTSGGTNGGSHENDPTSGNYRSDHRRFCGWREPLEERPRVAPPPTPLNAPAAASP